MSEDIHILLGKYFSGELSAAEEARVKQWSEASEENLAEFKLMQEIWTSSWDTKTISFDTDQAWNKVNSRISIGGNRGMVRTMTRMAIGIAASLVLILGAWWMMNRQSMESYTASTAVQELLLDDGSKVYLKEGSTLHYPGKFKGKKREVTLEGEAFFDINRDPSKPFIINAAATEVEVLGTSFSLNTKENKVELIVKTGKVKFSGKDASVLVVAGERALFDQDQIIKQENKDLNFNAWQSKQLIFNNSTLEEVIRTIGDYYKVNIAIAEADKARISATSVTTSFNNQSLESVLKELSLITTYKFEKLSEGNYVISSN